MKLKNSLLLDIITSQEIPNKYSKGFLNLLTIFKLEEQEGFKLPDYIINKFKKLEQKFISFYNNIPLRVIEKYYIKYMLDYNKYVYIEYNGFEIDNLKVIDIYLLLEQFFDDLYLIASLIASYYSLEIKINKPNKDSLDNVL